MCAYCTPIVHLLCDNKRILGTQKKARPVQFGDRRGRLFVKIQTAKSMEKDATTSTLFGVNQFSKAFAEFDEEAFFDNLHNQVRNKSYFEKYKGFKTTLLCLSYVFNMASALTASYAVYWFINWITGMAIVGYIVAGVALFFLELHPL